jgi:hypothetical protein
MENWRTLSETPSASRGRTPSASRGRCLGCAQFLTLSARLLACAVLGFRPDAVQPRDEEVNAEDPVIGHGKSLSPQPARDSALLELEFEHELDLMTKHLTSAGEQSLPACKKQRVSPLGGTEFVVFDRRPLLVHKMGTICDNQWVFTGHALQMHVLPNFVPQCRQLHRALVGGTDCGSR